MFSRPKILFLVSLLFVALLNSIPTYLLNFEFFYHFSIYIYMYQLIEPSVNVDAAGTSQEWTSRIDCGGLIHTC